MTRSYPIKSIDQQGYFLTRQGSDLVTLGDLGEELPRLQCRVCRHMSIFHSMAEKAAEASDDVLHGFRRLTFLKAS